MGSLVSGGFLERILLGERDDPTADDKRRQVRMGIDVACAATGVGIAWYLRGWAALWSSCTLGARLLCETFGVTDSEHSAFAITALTCVGFSYHFRHWGLPPLPVPLNMILIPLRLAESTVVQLA